MALIIYAILFLYMHKSKVSHDTVHMSFNNNNNNYNNVFI